MATIRILSGGAAQAVVEKLSIGFERETGHKVNGEFSAVGAMRDKLVAGDPADMVILTAPLIDELSAQGHVVAGSRADLGRIGTGVAVRAGAPLPDVSTPESLRGSLLAAAKIVCPDPAVATAGKVVMAMLERLGIGAEVKARMQFFPNGYAAMRWLTASGGDREIGITQMTEIRANNGVTLAGPLPEDLQSKATYAAGLAARGVQSDAARRFIGLLTAPESRALLIESGFEP